MIELLLVVVLFFMLDSIRDKLKDINKKLEAIHHDLREDEQRPETVVVHVPVEKDIEK